MLTASNSPATTVSANRNAGNGPSRSLMKTLLIPRTSGGALWSELEILAGPVTTCSFSRLQRRLPGAALLWSRRSVGYGR